jgi:hypothetical protein
MDMVLERGSIERYVGSGFRQVARAACARAERAISQAEECVAWGGPAALVPVIDDLCVLVGELADQLADLDLAADLLGSEEVDEGRARIAWQRVQATTALLRAMTR